MYPVEHTSKLIKGTLSRVLDGKRVALCVTGSVAAVECVDLARRLMRHGADVYCVMSKSAQNIIHPYLLEWATGNHVVTELTGQIEHVTLAGTHPGHVDVVLIAPATANTIGKIANGIDDTPVTTTASSALGAHIPIIIVPAMHRSLYDHPIVLENIERLKRIGVQFVQPRMQEAKAKFPEIDTVVESVFRALGTNDLRGQHFVVTAGPTRGWIDRVRFMTNPSTGKMGIELAREVLARGGDVTLVLGPTSEEPPENADVVRVESSKEMLDAVIRSIESKHSVALISAAAVLDFEPEKREDRKRPSGQDYTVRLVSTPKIIEEARSRFKELFIVGFKVESGITDEELESRAREKITAGICDLVVANDERRKGVAFGADTNEVLIVGPKGVCEKVPLSSKRDVARRVVDVMRTRMTKK